MIRQFFLVLIRIYKTTLSPFLGSNCRFYPSCSSYTQEALEKKGAFEGLRLGFVRLMKCHPFHPGGIDCVE